MFAESSIKCEICGHRMGSSPGFDNDKEYFDICVECEAAVKAAKEQRKYLQSLQRDKK